MLLKFGGRSTEQMAAGWSAILVVPSGSCALCVSYTRTIFFWLVQEDAFHCGSPEDHFSDLRWTTTDSFAWHVPCGVCEVRSITPVVTEPYYSSTWFRLLSTLSTLPVVMQNNEQISNFPQSTKYIRARQYGHCARLRRLGWRLEVCLVFSIIHK